MQGGVSFRFLSALSKLYVLERLVLSGRCYMVETLIKHGVSFILVSQQPNILAELAEKRQNNMILSLLN